MVNLEVNQSNERSAGRCDVLIELVLMTIRRTDAHIRANALIRAPATGGTRRRAAGTDAETANANGNANRRAGAGVPGTT